MDEIKRKVKLTHKSMRWLNTPSLPLCFSLTLLLKKTVTVCVCVWVWVCGCMGAWVCRWGYLCVCEREREREREIERNVWVWMGVSHILFCLCLKVELLTPVFSNFTFNFPQSLASMQTYSLLLDHTTTFLPRCWLYVSKPLSRLLTSILLFPIILVFGHSPSSSD